MPACCRLLQAFTIGRSATGFSGFRDYIGTSTVSHTSPSGQPAPAQKQRHRLPSLPSKPALYSLHSLHHLGATACTVLVRLHCFGAVCPALL